ncbi:CARDB domain-containing protein [Candidatus Nanosalina sp. VS9-1]|uniref:CARDB domain-containing protein n=1 Tax=Candidatus Nanosalina sp. VS9-1 TaxID=3388566 RepID=UPI0039DF2FFE
MSSKTFRLFFSLILVAGAVQASTVNISSQDEINMSTGASISWNSTQTFNSTGLNFSDQKLAFERSNDSDITYSAVSQSGSDVNMTIFGQKFYSRPFPGETVFDFQAEASSGSEIFFSFGGFPVVSSGQYRSFNQGSELNRSGTGTVSWSFSDWSTHSFSVEHNRTDLVVGEVDFNRSQPVQGQETRFTANISNPGAENLTSLFNFTERKFNGSQFQYTDSQARNVTVENQSWKLVNFTFESKLGLYNYSIEADYLNEVNETNESNNFNSSDYQVSSYHIFYGGSELIYKLGTSKTLKDWSLDMPSGNLYYSDDEAVYSISDLRPLNLSGDLQEADEALSMSTHPDSIQEVYDKDGDGEADSTRCYTVLQEQLCDVPVANSTNSTNFVTGLLYDTADGTDFNGTQDLVFITESYSEPRQGRYGVYAYESRIPSKLSNQVLEGRFVKYRLEFH